MTYMEEIRDAAKSGMKGAHSVANVLLAIDVTRHPDHFDIYVGGLTQINAF